MASSGQIWTDKTDFNKADFKHYISLTKMQ